MDWKEQVTSHFIQQKVAILCARYNYRGVLAEVEQDHLVLSNACSVEVSGPSNSAKARTEDPIGSSVVIMKDAIELIYQPQFCFAPLPGEDGYEEATSSEN